ncbi:MAG: hypothetical protein JWQ96_2074, partial [Segetibacter sp.]|nr:hypothetical protein [Segetibacter sp.]
MKTKRLASIALITLSIACASSKKPAENTAGATPASASKDLPGTKYVKVAKDGSLVYIPDEKGNIIPDFSRVGFYGGDMEIPDIAVVKTVNATGTDADQTIIQNAIDEVSKREADKNGFKGAILLKKGLYRIPSTIKIESSG